MKKIALDLADWYSGFYPKKLLPVLEESQFWPRERLEVLQIEYLRRLLIHASQHVPYYRDLFRKLSFDPQALSSLRDIEKIPIIGKTDITSQVERFISETAQKPTVWLQTTGTTGHPFRFVRTREAESYKIACRLRFRHWYDINRDSRLLNVGGIPPKTDSLRDCLKHRIHFWATRRIEVFSSDLEGNGKENAAQRIEKHRLDAVMGYPTGISALAQYLATGRRLKYQPKAVFTNSETLTKLMRQRIRNGFGVEPRNDYVATEGSIAHECPQGGLHADMESTLLELVPSEKPDGSGEVVVTMLHTFDFPLIRYRLGDLARWSEKPCSCGRGLVTLQDLLGRSSDGIAVPDGRVFTAANINMRIAHFPFIDRIRQYQIVQVDSDNLELRILTAPETDNEAVTSFQAALSELFGVIKVSVKLVKDLPREPSGKFRPVIGLNAPKQIEGSD